MRFIQGRYGVYPDTGKLDLAEIQKRLLWLKEMEKRYYYIERFAKEELCIRNSRSNDYWAIGTTPF